MAISWLTGACAVGFALIHLFIGRLRFLDVVPRSRWLSFAGGVAVTYVFLHVLPELAAHQQRFAHALGLGELQTQLLLHSVALAGLTAFYGLERAAQASRRRAPTRRRAGPVDLGTFRAHILSFTLYNVIVGYLLTHREVAGVWSLALYFVAIGFHFLTGDYGLHADHRAEYDRIGRWTIAGAVLSGWLLGQLVELPATAIAVLFAFVAGAIILVVLKEELPEQRQSRFWPFLLGGAGYAALLWTAGP